MKQPEILPDEVELLKDLKAMTYEERLTVCLIGYGSIAADAEELAGKG